MPCSTFVQVSQFVQTTNLSTWNAGIKARIIPGRHVPKLARYLPRRADEGTGMTEHFLLFHALCQVHSEAPISTALSVWQLDGFKCGLIPDLYISTWTRSCQGCAARAHSSGRQPCMPIAPGMGGWKRGGQYRCIYICSIFPCSSISCSGSLPWLLEAPAFLFVCC